MKKLFALALVPVIAIGILLNTGCVSTTTIGPNGQTNVVTTLDPVAKAAVQVGTTLALNELLLQDPTNAPPYIKLFVASLDSVIGGTNYSPAAVSLALNAVPSTALSSQYSKLAVDSVLAIYSAYAPAIQGQVNSNSLALDILTTIRDAAAQSLSLTPATRSGLHKQFNRAGTIPAPPATK